MRLEHHSEMVATQQDGHKRTAELNELQFRLNEYAEFKANLEQQVNDLHRYREQQAAEIHRLMQALAASARESTINLGTSEARKHQERIHSTLTKKVAELQDVVSQQYKALRELTDDKVRLSALLFKYESDLANEQKQGGTTKHRASRRPANADALHDQ